MRKIAGPGAVGNAFVDYDAVTNPNGTVHTADWANDVQNELIGIQENAGIAEAAGTNEYILAAITKQIQDFSKPIGELYYLDSLKVAAAFDKDDLTAYFNGICLDAVNVSQTLSATNWPDLVPHLRAKGLTYNEGITGAKSSFDVTNWAIAANVATLTFANTTAEIAILTALLEDNLVHGSYADWRSITLASAIGDITAGEYAITAVDATLRTVSFAFVSANNTGAGAFTANFYTNRIPGSTTTARVYEATARSLVSANDDDGENINGLRRRDKMQGHWSEAVLANGGQSGASTGSRVRINIGDLGPTTSVISTLGVIRDPINDGINGTPRTGKTTDPRSQTAHLYIHGKSYVA